MLTVTQPPIPTEDEVKAAIEGYSSTLEDDIQLSAVCPHTNSSSEFCNLSKNSGGLMLDAFSSWGIDMTNVLAEKIGKDSTVSEEAGPFPPSPDTKLSSITKFISPSGTFLLDPPKQITLHQGTKSTVVTLDESDTLKSLADKLNDAIAAGLGQSKYK